MPGIVLRSPCQPVRRPASQLAVMRYYHRRATAPAHRQNAHCCFSRLVIKDHQDVVTTGAGRRRRELYVPVTRVRESPESLGRISRCLKIARRKSVFGDSESFLLGQVPIGVLSGTASEGHCEDEYGDTRHKPNEKEISHGRVRWQTRGTCFGMGPLASSGWFVLFDWSR